MVIIPETVHRVHLLKPKTYIVPKNRDEEKAKPAFNDEITTSYTTVIAVENRPFKAKLRLILVLTTNISLCSCSSQNFSRCCAI
jgi:hypothetical protein